MSPKEKPGAPRRAFTGERKRRAFGQHFLRDRKVIGAVVEAFLEGAEKHGAQLLVEIGPGKGALTEPLLAGLAALQANGVAPRTLRLFERDRELVALWQSRIAASPVAFEVVEGDFMQAPEAEWNEPSPVAVVSNLPYSAGTAIAQRLLLAGPGAPFHVLMFQAEVARRFRAAPNGAERGSLSVWAQNHWDIERVCFVPPGAFQPPPKVDSEVLRFTRRATPRVQGTEARPELWQELIKRTFAQRRKMIRSNLNGDPWAQALRDSGVDPTLRAQALDWTHWESLWKALPAARA
ncbi:MAG: ribosomal RNA small subunit methyltransferase A [Bdellovibrionales bacterium]|nr:ribosomal RNA small subunit methyltransferase A [Bdellovibrionales bacterium]